MPKLTPVRAHRLKLGVPLVTATVYASLPLSRASEIERNPALARPGELAALRAGVERAARERDRKPVHARASDPLSIGEDE